MSESFDPYHVWLGIPPSQQPPNHYRLLGIELFEADPDVIASAADKQMSHLRSFQTGKHGALTQKLLNEVAAARICLLHPDKKSAYDALLRAASENGREEEYSVAVPDRWFQPAHPALTSSRTRSVSLSVIVTAGAAVCLLLTVTGGFLLPKRASRPPKSPQVAVKPVPLRSRQGAASPAKPPAISKPVPPAATKAGPPERQPELASPVAPPAPVVEPDLPAIPPEVTAQRAESAPRVLPENREGLPPLRNDGVESKTTSALPQETTAKQTQRPAGLPTGWVKIINRKTGLSLKPSEDGLRIEQGDGYSMIRGRKSDEYLALTKAAERSEELGPRALFLRLRPDAAIPSAQWSIEPLENGFWRIINRHTGKCLEYRTAERPHPVRHSFFRQDALEQQWSFEPADKP